MKKKIVCPHCNKEFEITISNDDLNKDVRNALIQRDMEHKKELKVLEDKMKKDFIDQQRMNVMMLENKQIIKSSIGTGNDFEEMVFNQLKQSFPDDEIKWLLKKDGNGDILQVISFDDFKACILFEIKTGKYTSNWESKLEEDMKKHKNTLFGVLITVNLPQNKMIKENKDWIFNPKTRTFIIKADKYEDYIYYVRMLAKYSIESMVKTKGAALSSKEQKAIEVLYSNSFRKSIIDLVDISNQLGTKIEKERVEDIKLIEKRYSEKKDLLLKLITSSNEVTKLIPANTTNKIKSKK